RSDSSEQLRPDASGPGRHQQPEPPGDRWNRRLGIMNPIHPLSAVRWPLSVVRWRELTGRTRELRHSQTALTSHRSGSSNNGPRTTDHGQKERSAPRTTGHGPRTRSRGFTLVELLVVITIILIVSAVALPTVLPAISHRQVSEGARILQGALVGA